MSAEQRVAVLHEPERMSVETRPVPAPGPGDVQVAVRAVSVCGSDVHYYDHGRIGGFVMHGPLVLGHETSGVVSAVGDGVELLRQQVVQEPRRVGAGDRDDGAVGAVHQRRLGDALFAERVAVVPGHPFGVEKRWPRQLLGAGECK